MKRTLVSFAAISTLALFGCSSNSDSNYEPTPAPVPTVATNSPTNPSEEQTRTPETQMPEPETQKPTPTTPVPTTTEAGTPATQFAERWGKKYPQIPEYAILKAANKVCDVIGVAGPDWTNNPLIVSAMQEAILTFGLAENDAVEFATDAQQNYCSSVSNPT